MERPKMTKETYEYLELYLYGLVKYTETLEFLQDTNSQKQLKLMHELSTVNITLNVLKSVIDIEEEPVIAWEADASEYLVYYRFTNPHIASLALGCKEKYIIAVCEGDMAKANGYYFCYEDEFDIDMKVFNPNSNEFKLE